MAKFVGKKAREGHGWRLEELIILHHLRRYDDISAKEASTILQRTQKEASETLSLMEGVFLERVGTGRGTYYQLGHEILSSLGNKEKYTRIKGLSEEQKLQLLKNYIETNGRITNEEARVVCGINRHQATRLIQKLVRKGLLELKGKGRGAYYEKMRFTDCVNTESVFRLIQSIPSRKASFASSGKKEMDGYYLTLSRFKSFFY